MAARTGLASRCHLYLGIGQMLLVRAVPPAAAQTAIRRRARHHRRCHELDPGDHLASLIGYQRRASGDEAMAHVRTALQRRPDLSSPPPAGAADRRERA